MQYAHVENGRVEYIGPLPKNWRTFSGMTLSEEDDTFKTDVDSLSNTLGTLGWFPATVTKETPATRKAKEDEVTHIVETLDKVIIVQRVRE
tara:strand:- start:711 stop:983 length:273 start_codon:yes stop_codon:yes gene_type:complete